VCGGAVCATLASDKSRRRSGIVWAGELGVKLCVLRGRLGLREAAKVTVLLSGLGTLGIVSSGRRRRMRRRRRVVLVKLTEAGMAALEDYRAQASAALGKYLTEMPDHQIEELAAATKTLAQLVNVLQQATIT
jgi:hypothetical protein